MIAPSPANGEIGVNRYIIEAMGRLQNFATCELGRMTLGRANLGWTWGPHGTDLCPSGILQTTFAHATTFL